MKTKNALCGLSMAVVLQLGVLAGSAQTYVYTYTGNDFTSVSNAPNESSYGFVPYTTSDKVTGSITFSAPLGDNYEGNPSLLALVTPLRADKIHRRICFRLILMPCPADLNPFVALDSSNNVYVTDLTKAN
jgi:hypothetical protein